MRHCESAVPEGDVGAGTSWIFTCIMAPVITGCEGICTSIGSSVSSIQQRRLVLPATLAMTTAPGCSPGANALRRRGASTIAGRRSENLTGFPGEHATFVPIRRSLILVFVSSGIKGGNGGAAVLQTQDLQTFTYATGLGYAEQVMKLPLGLHQLRFELRQRVRRELRWAWEGVENPRRHPAT